MIEVLCALILAAAGFAAGWKAALWQHKPPQLPAPEEQELQQLREDKAAFAMLMGYNAQRAYGEEDMHGV